MTINPLTPLGKSVRTLTRSYRDLKVDSLALGGEPTLDHLCAVLEREILPLLPNLTAEEVYRLYPDLAQTLSPVIMTSIPEIGTPPHFRVTPSLYDTLFSQPAELFVLCALNGLTTPTEHGPTFERLKTLVALGKDNPAWLEGLSLWIQSQTGVSAFLSYTTAVLSKDLPAPTQPVAKALTTGIGAHLSACSDKGMGLLEDSLAGSSTPDSTILILLGVPLPPKPTIGGPRVSALYDSCVSGHGRLALQKRLGPADVFLAKGEFPEI